MNKQETRQKRLAYYKDISRVKKSGLDYGLAAAVDRILYLESVRDNLQTYKLDAIHLFKNLTGGAAECTCDPDVGAVPCFDCAVRLMANGRAWSNG